MVAVASGPGRYVDVHAAVRAGEGLGSAVELVACVVALVSRGQGTPKTSGVAYVVALEIEDRADEGEAVGGGQENDDAFACVA